MMGEWHDIQSQLPEEEELITVCVNGKERPHYYRLYKRFYDLDDLERWRMKTSKHWKEDRTWYLHMEQIERWKYDGVEPSKKRKLRARFELSRE